MNQTQYVATLICSWPCMWWLPSPLLSLSPFFLQEAGAKFLWNEWIGNLGGAAHRWALHERERRKKLAFSCAAEPRQSPLGENDGIIMHFLCVLFISSMFFCWFFFQGCWEKRGDPYSWGGQISLPPLGRCSCINNWGGRGWGDTAISCAPPTCGKNN